jgi:hypothetical protein
MSDPSSRPGTGSETDGRSGDGSPPRTPRWVWVSVIVVGAVIVLAVVLLLVAGGEHGPGHHQSFGGALPSTAMAVASGGAQR